jgi:hypothetical protein
LKLDDCLDQIARHEHVHHRRETHGRLFLARLDSFLGFGRELRAEPGLGVFVNGVARTDQFIKSKPSVTPMAMLAANKTAVRSHVTQLIEPAQLNHPSASDEKISGRRQRRADEERSARWIEHLVAICREASSTRGCQCPIISIRHPSVAPMTNAQRMRVARRCDETDMLAEEIAEASQEGMENSSGPQ